MGQIFDREFRREKTLEIAKKMAKLADNFILRKLYED